MNYNGYYSLIPREKTEHYNEWCIKTWYTLYGAHEADIDIVISHANVFANQYQYNMDYACVSQNSILDHIKIHLV